MEEPKESSIFRVLMFPWLAHGHISPFLQLSKKLTERNFHIYFCSTAINFSFIKKHISDDHQSIELVELHLPELPELPPHYHTTKNLPPHLLSTLVKSFQNASSSFISIIKNLSPDLLIYDGFQSWAPALAAQNNIPSVHLLTSGAATMSFFYHSIVYSFDSDHGFPFSEIFLRDYEIKNLHAARVEEQKKGLVADNHDYVLRCFDLSSEIVLIKSCREVEKKYLDYLSFLCGKKMVTLGPLILESTKEEENDYLDIINFLNNKDQSSVVFVSFGSEFFSSKEEREEIACGLELSNVNFIWVVRSPVGKEISIEEAVPEGFLERVKERGMVVKEWAPQAKILEHSSTGGFVSHCGWSSTIESLYYGVPLIAMPMHHDQPFNARLLVEFGVGIEVLRGDNGQLKREEIARVIRMVVLEKAGEETREKARELSRKLRIKGEEELDEALEELRNLCSKKQVNVDLRN
ncbi:hypothetical protein ACH5RR_031100 [Cinchona calisaya]|uniref:Glycosyltransferase n=1 Tax=Cinchona calisaya TaxID=153742 RepID=A0ABD2YF95_9GENT